MNNKLIMADVPGFFPWNSYALDFHMLYHMFILGPSPFDPLWHGRRCL